LNCATPRARIVGYGDIQFIKAANVLPGGGLAHLSKNETLLSELDAKGMAPN